MAEVIFLIGPPCSGKSTWIKNEADGEFTICSTDDLISWYGEKYNRSYNDVFNSGITRAFESIFKQSIKDLTADNKNIIIDRTNTTVSTREKILSLIPENYKKTAVYFDVGIDTLLERNKVRSETGKHIPAFVIKNFKNKMEIPTLEEFDEIIKVE